jgi:hypothetical protein
VGNRTFGCLQMAVLITTTLPDSKDIFSPLNPFFVFS